MKLTGGDKRKIKWELLTFMHSHPTVVTLYNLICILAVVTKTDTADEYVLSAPGLGPVLQGILGN